MNQSMLLIEEIFGNPNFGIVSITIDPRMHDTRSFERTCCAFRSQVLKLEFLTGDRDKIYDLANKGLYAGENSKVNGGFEHSGLFA
jgi:protein SCO1/2